MLAYTYGTNGNPIPDGKEYSVNLIDKALIEQDINAVKEKKPDLICVSIHFGVEGVEAIKNPENKDQIEMSNWLHSQGVDIVLGSHPHVLQSMKLTDNNFTIYSLGNFISNQQWRYSDSSIILNLHFKKDNKTGVVTIQDVDYVPVFVHRSKVNGKSHYRVLEINSAIANYENGSDKTLNATDYQNLKRALQDIYDVVGKESMYNL